MLPGIWERDVKGVAKLEGRVGCWGLVAFVEVIVSSSGTPGPARWIRGSPTGTNPGAGQRVGAGHPESAAAG